MAIQSKTKGYKNGVQHKIIPSFYNSNKRYIKGYVNNSDYGIKKTGGAT